MREIKFRVFDKFQSKYIFEGYHVIGEVTVFGGIDMEIHDTWKERSTKYGYASTIEAWDDFIEEQFTGLKDKNGKDIYEGDILKTATDKNMKVDWSNKFASFVVNRDGWAFSHWFGEACNPEDTEVIGNINTNIELLNNKK